MLLTAKILLTVATLIYATFPSFFDTNDTHATNPAWARHARFHVVWQVSSYTLIGLVGMVLIWTSGQEMARLWAPAALAGAVYGGFWTAVLTRRLYGGRLTDETNPVPPIKWPFGGGKVETEANVTVFVFTTTCLVAAVVLLIAL